MSTDQLKPRSYLASRFFALNQNESVPYHFVRRRGKVQAASTPEAHTPLVAPSGTPLCMQLERVIQNGTCTTQSAARRLLTRIQKLGSNIAVKYSQRRSVAVIKIILLGRMYLKHSTALLKGRRPRSEEKVKAFGKWT